MNNIDKLYMAVTFADVLRDRINVRIDWFKHGPGLQKMNYDELIEGYDLLDEEEKAIATEIVDEFFTKEEVDILQEYLDKNAYIGTGAFLVGETSLPMSVKRANGELYTPVGHISYGSNTISLNMEPSCDLPFEVWGHYNIDNHLPAENLPWEHIDDGIQFLKEGTSAVLPNVDVENLFSEELIREIYRKRQLYVSWNVRLPLPEEYHQSSYDQLTKSAPAAHVLRIIGPDSDLGSTSVPDRESTM
jgi:hypothetical protein